MTRTLQAPAEPQAEPAGAPPPRRPRWHPVWRVLLYLTAYVVVQTAAALPVLALWRRLAGTDLAVYGYEAILTLFVLFAPAMLGVTALFARWLDRRTLAGLGVRLPPRPGRAAIWGLAGPVVLLGAWLALALLVGAVAIQGLADDFLEGPAIWRGPAGSVLLLLGLAALFLLQGAVEELAVRGYIYRALMDRWPRWLAAVVSSVIFAAMHLLNGHASAAAMINTALIGLIFVLMVERWDSLWVAAIAHGVWNWTLACIVSLPVSGIRLFHVFEVARPGPRGLTGGLYGPEGSWLLTGVLAVALVGLGLAWRPHLAHKGADGGEATEYPVGAGRP